jgi:glycosyltransferase involved in cell wall biosynthesis
MKIGYFITRFPYQESFNSPTPDTLYPTGGANTVAYKLARQMVKRGHEVVVFTASRDNKNHLEEYDGIKIYRYATIFRLEKAFFSLGLFSQPRHHDVDIIHLHFDANPAGTLPGLYYARNKKKPFIVHYHGDTDTSYGKLARRVGLYLFEKLGVNPILSAARYVIVNSLNYIEISHFLSKYKEKCIAIPPGIDISDIETAVSKEDCRKQLSIPMDKKVILFVGTLINYKNPYLLIKALSRVNQYFSETILIMVGDGPLRSDLEKLAGELGISDKVRFTGTQVGNTKAMYYKAADIFVLPSTGVTESFGIVLLEASIAGLPLVVSSLETFRALVKDGYNGLETKAGDVSSLAGTIMRLLSSDELRNKMGENARACIGDYTWENIAEKTEALYLNTIQEGITN